MVNKLYILEKMGRNIASSRLLRQHVDFIALKLLLEMVEKIKSIKPVKDLEWEGHNNAVSRQHEIF